MGTSPPSSTGSSEFSNHLDAGHSLPDSAATLPFAEAFNAPQMFYQELPSRLLYKHSDNELRELEVQLQQELIALGRSDMADAVAGGRKYQRLEWAMYGASTFEGAVGLRLAFNPDAQVPNSKKEWIEEAMAKYADDEGLKVVVAEWAVEKPKWEAEKKKRKAEEKKKEDEAAAKAAAEAQAAPKAGAATAAGESEAADHATADVKTAGEKVGDTVPGSDVAKQLSSETTAVEEGGGDKSMTSNESEQKAVVKLAEAAAAATIEEGAPNVAEV